MVKAGYKKTEVGLIPEDWSVTALKNIAKLQRGKFSARPRNDPRYYDGQTPFIQTGDIARSNGRNVQYSKTLNVQGISVSKVFPENTLFFTIAANIGDLAIVKYKAACPDSLIAIQNIESIDKEWLLHELRSKKRAFEGLATQNAQLNINLEKLNPYKIPVPKNLNEQKAIAEVLSDIDRLIASLEALIEKKHQIKTGAMQQLLTGKTRLPGFGEGKGFKQTELGEIPEDWECLPLLDLTSRMTNGFVGTATKHYTTKDNGVTYIQGYNVEANSFKFHGIKKVSRDFHIKNSKSSLREGDVLTVQTGDVGLTTFVPPSFGEANCHALIISRFKADLAEPRFYSFYMNSPDGRLRLKDLEVGTTMKHINVGDLLQWKVPYPPNTEEQKAIANALSDIDTELASLELRLAKTKALKQGMMQELLTGRTRLI